jgi:pyridinium-3,5-biscarboxylic acid mononucleotide synthase
MTDAELLALLAELKQGTIPSAEAHARILRAMRDAPYENLDFARIDHHRAVRQGVPEVVFGQGKTPSQIALIAEKIVGRGHNLLVTRATREAFDAVKKVLPDAVFHENARAITRRPAEPNASDATSAASTRDAVVPDASVPRGAPGPDAGPHAAGAGAGSDARTVLVVSAGTSDMPVADEAAVSAEAMGLQVERLYDVGVAGLHRLLGERGRLDSAAVIIVVAGMEGALPSVVGGLVRVPVIAVPTSVGYGASFGGLAALLGMLNSCAAGVAVVNIDNGYGAAALAARILLTR